RGTASNQLLVRLPTIGISRRRVLRLGPSGGGCGVAVDERLEQNQGQNRKSHTPRSFYHCSRMSLFERTTCERREQSKQSTRDREDFNHRSRSSSLCPSPLDHFHQ